MNRNEILAQIEKYKRNDGSYDVRRMEKDLAIRTNFWDDSPDTDPRVILAVEINSRMVDEEKQTERTRVQSALNRFHAGTATIQDMLLLERSGLVVAIYGDPDSERPTAFRFKDYRDIDGNEYTDQAGLEEKPGRL